jgi:hypothetical protein
MRGEVPGMYVPDDIVARLRGVPEDRVAAEGLALCADVIRQVREIPGVAGVHVMAIGWEDAVPEILERAGLGRRDEGPEQVRFAGARGERSSELVPRPAPPRSALVLAPHGSP